MKTEREKLLEAALKECADFIEENYRQIHPFTSKAELKRLVAEHVILRRARAALKGKP